MPSSGPQHPRGLLNLGQKLLISVAVINGFFLAVLFVLRLFGLIRPFYVPAGSMAPAISAGDHVYMEGLTFLERKPRHGDIVVFKTDGTGLPAGQVYVKRVAGEPGDHVQILGGKVFVNDTRLALSNKMGEIVYYAPAQAETFSPKTGVIVPAGCYFLLGDNSTNSLDSRYCGPVPRNKILGRILFCYWPLQRVGEVK
jgi:signal peptidase I